MIHNLLKGKEIILASASPRRKEIFQMMGLSALQMPAHIDENNFCNNPRKLVITHAENKALAIRKAVDNDYLIVGSDTIVFQNSEILEKPENKFQAAEFLTRLSGTHHYVYTGIAISYKNQLHSGYEKTKVFFRDLTAFEIEEYINTKEPMDKAGAYGIQGLGSQFVKKISGCYFNVMGFPVYRFYKLLEEIL
ncbi:MAG: nucleoside triphosphate pyrophosphatase [Candidatus Tenebribacter davisii]|jgi:septum formation protein|nr:nucleoside triphosphate pyrophosphatase [Candidatus Tenebribacter davisii]